MREMKTITFPGDDKKYEIVDGKARDDLNNLIEVIEKETVEIPTIEDLNTKASKVQIDYIGGKVFKHGDVTLNFADIYDYHLTKPDFTFIVYGNRAYLCSFVDVDSAYKEMRFDSVINSDLRTKVSSIYITSTDGVNIADVTVSNINSENSSNKVSVITDSDKASTDKYPSVKAVADCVDPIKQNLTDTESRLSEISARTDKLPIALDYERTGQDFDFTNAINNKAIKSEDGSIIDNESYWISGRIYVGDSTSVICNTDIYKIAFYKSSDRLAEPTKSVAKNVVCPIPANTSYLVFQIEKANRSFEERKLVIMSMGESLSKESKYYKYSLEADILNTASKSMLIKDSLFDNFELGTLNSSNGQWDGGINNTRATETLYIHLKSIVSVSIDDAKHILIMGYDKAKKWTGTSTGWIESKKEFSREEISELFDDSKIEYVRFAFRKQSGGTITDLKDFYSGIVINYPLVNVQIEELQQKFAEPTQHTYYGEKIRLEQMLDYESIGNFIGQQGGCVYGDYLFRFNTDDTFRVYDIPTKSYIGAFTLDGGLKPHCNSAVFGNEKYNSSDEFPLLYVNAYNTQGLPKGTCYVHRIARSGNNFSTTLVQTIRIGFTDDPIWTSGSIDTRPYGNFAVDCDNSFLYVYTLRNEDNKTRFFKFALPKLSDGSTVTISKDAILEYWDCDFFPYIQDNHYYKGKLYLCTGYGNEYNGYIRVVDVIRKQEVSTINLNEIGLAIEPECIDIYDGHLICGTRSIIYKFTF